MQELLDVLYKHIELIELLGYKLDLKKGELPIFSPANILKDNKKVGTLFLERVNLYYLNLDRKFLGNMNLKDMKFSRKKEKNERIMFHTIIKDKNIDIDCYNAILQDENIQLLGKDINVSNDCIQYLSDKSQLYVYKHSNGVTVSYNDNSIDISNYDEIKNTEIIKNINSIIGNNALKYMLKKSKEKVYKLQ